MNHDTKTRFAFIETCLLWGSGLTANQLAQAFGIARQNAQQVISRYRQQHPGNIRLQSRKQVATTCFEPYYIRRNAREFLDYLRGQAMMAYYLDTSDWVDLPFYDVDHLLRGRLKDSVVRQVLTALREQQVINVYYQAKTSARMRDFSPNQLIFAGNRYHVRGFCHLTERYLDFVLSRITHAETTRCEWVSSANDPGWQTYVELRFKPNPALPSEAIEALKIDFETDPQGIHHVKCRRALQGYIVREMLAPDPQFSTTRWVEVKHS